MGLQEGEQHVIFGEWEKYIESTLTRQLYPLHFPLCYLSYFWCIEHLTFDHHEDTLKGRRQIGGVDRGRSCMIFGWGLDRWRSWEEGGSWNLWLKRMVCGTCFALLFSLSSLLPYLHPATSPPLYHFSSANRREQMNATGFFFLFFRLLLPPPSSLLPPPCSSLLPAPPSSHSHAQSKTNMPPGEELDAVQLKQLELEDQQEPEEAVGEPGDDAGGGGGASQPPSSSQR